MNLASFFGESSTQEPEDLLDNIYAFATSFAVACRANERAEFLCAKQAAAEEERLKRISTRTVSAGASSKLRSESASRYVTDVAAHADTAACNERQGRREGCQNPESHLMRSMQDSLRRGEFTRFKQMHVQMQEQMQALSSELAVKMKLRRESISDSGHNWLKSERETKSYLHNY